MRGAERSPWILAAPQFRQGFWSVRMANVLSIFLSSLFSGLPPSDSSSTPTVFFRLRGFPRLVIAYRNQEESKAYAWQLGEMTSIL